MIALSEITFSLEVVDRAHSLDSKSLLFQSPFVYQRLIIMSFTWLGAFDEPCSCLYDTSSSFFCSDKDRYRANEARMKRVQVCRCNSIYPSWDKDCMMCQKRGANTRSFLSVSCTHYVFDHLLLLGGLRCALLLHKTHSVTHRSTTSSTCSKCWPT